MANLRLEPFRDFVSLREAMNSLLEDSVVRPYLAGQSQARSFPVDIHQTENELVVRASVPGVRPEDLQITVLNGVLTLKAEHKSLEQNGTGQYLRQEISYGLFERSFELPFQVQADKAQAQFEHGILTVRLPKADEAKPKQIRINVANAIEGEKSS
ncbi:MAG: Hsp20/alpha crystallin family protein [Chloroflexi bacterium]|nr:Hsp20/alpha crystallin family protein [Chloroflexota bacterium]